MTQLKELIGSKMASNTIKKTSRIYLWQDPKWPDFKWNKKEIADAVSKTRALQKQLLGISGLLDIHEQAKILTDEALTTSAIEGEKLDTNSLRSSVAKRLNLQTAGLKSTSKSVDGLIKMLVDATSDYEEELSLDTLNNWHRGLFAHSHSSHDIEIGQIRTSPEPMRVVSGSFDAVKVHFEAPPAKVLNKEMKQFTKWWNNPPPVDGLIRAGIAHLWFVTIHPYDDGNGRIARVLTEKALAQDEKTGKRLYSISSQILKERSHYYELLEKTQKSDLDITEWLIWFLEILARSFGASQTLIEKSLYMSDFWKQHRNSDLNERQRKVLQKMLEAEPEGFIGGMTNKKYVSITKISRETAKRDLSELEHKNILIIQGKGRSVHYRLALSLADKTRLRK